MKSASTSAFILALCLPLWADEKPEAPAAEAAKPAVLISMDQVELPQKEDVKVLGTLFRGRTGGFVNFIPLRHSHKGVWSSQISPEVKKEAADKIKRGKHQAVVATCRIVVHPGKPRPANPNGAVTGAYLGPVNQFTIISVEMLDGQHAATVAAVSGAAKKETETFMKRLD